MLVGKAHWTQCMMTSRVSFLNNATKNAACPFACMPETQELSDVMMRPNNSSSLWCAHISWLLTKYVTRSVKIVIQWSGRSGLQWIKQHVALNSGGQLGVRTLRRALPIKVAPKKSQNGIRK